MILAVYDNSVWFAVLLQSLIFTKCFAFSHQFFHLDFGEVFHFGSRNDYPSFATACLIPPTPLLFSETFKFSMLIALHCDQVWVFDDPQAYDLEVLRSTVTNHLPMRYVVSDLCDPILTGLIVFMLVG